MNINRIQLNLLHAFKALIEEGQVTRAAQKLHITQAALSNSLKQLRELFCDELFVRSKRGVEPTARAKILSPQVNKVLDELQQLTNLQCQFNPAQSARTFVIAMSDYSEHAFLPPLMHALSQVAPHISIQLRHLNMLHNEADLDRNQYDLVIGFANTELKHAHRQPLLTVGAMCVGSKKYNVLNRKPTMQQYLSKRHIMLSYYDETNPLSGNSARVLREMGYQRDVAVTIPHVLPALNAVYETDYIATLPLLLGSAKQPLTVTERLKQVRKKYPDKLNYQPLPFELFTVDIELIWHRKTDNDPGLVWLRELIQSVADQLPN